MYHYTYLITYSDGKKYIGVRKSHVEPHLDTKYVGSSKYTPKDKIVSKTILKVFKTREEAIHHEIALHSKYDVGKNDLFYNRSKQTTSKFDTTGVSFIRTPKHNAKIKMALTGRIRSPEECLSISKAKKGKSRKPHSKETINKMSEARKGIAGYMKGRKYTKESQLKLYSSRTKYSDVISWEHVETKEVVQATCMEMGIDYGSGIKPTRGFRDLFKKNNNHSAYNGWRLHQTGTNDSC